MSTGARLALTQMTVFEQPRPSEDCVQWSAQLVCQRLQELILEPAGALGFRTRRTLAGEKFVDGLVHGSAELWRLEAAIASLPRAPHDALCSYRQVITQPTSARP